MAQQFLVQLLDDLKSEVAHGTVRFSLDGVQYIIDLTDRHASGLRQRLAPFISHSRRLRGDAGKTGPASAHIDPRPARLVRDWARDNGYKPSSRGRISKPMDAFSEAQRTSGR